MRLKTALRRRCSFSRLPPASAQTIDVPDGTYVADKAHTNLLWSVSHFGLSHYIGRFDSIDAKLQLDPKDPTSPSWK